MIEIHIGYLCIFFWKHNTFVPVYCTLLPGPSRRLKCKARRHLSLFSCNCVSHMTNYVNFKLTKDVEKNPGPTQYNTDHHEVIIRPFMKNHSSTMRFISPISSEPLSRNIQNGRFPNIFSFHIIHYTLFSSLKNICSKKDFHVARQTC